MIIGIIQGILIAIASLLGMVIIRNITTFFHEMGHAIPSLIFSNEPVVVYIGSYGDISKSLHFKLGRLTMYVRLNLFEWNLGMCKHGKIAGFWKRFITIIGGPVASLLVAVPLLVISITSDLSDGWIFVCSFFIIASLIDLVVNLIPKASPYMLHDGDTIVSDGMQLAILFSRRNLAEEYLEIEALHDEGKTPIAIEKAEELLDTEKPDKKTFYLLIEMLEKQKEFQRIVEIYNNFSNKWKYNFVDFRDLGKMHVLLNQHDAALHYLSMCFQEKHNDPETLLYLGMLHAGRGEHVEAVKYYNSSLDNYGSSSEALLSRAKSCIELEMFDEALYDLQQLKNRITTGEVQYWTGVVYEKKKNPDKALILLQKAKEMGFEHYALEYKIALNSGISF